MGSLPTFRRIRRSATLVALLFGSLGIVGTASAKEMIDSLRGSQATCRPDAALQLAGARERSIRPQWREWALEVERALTPHVEVAQSTAGSSSAGLGQG